MSSKPKKTPVGSGEKSLAKEGMKDLQRFEEAFRPLEQGAINELQTADATKRSAMLAGRSNADLEAGSAEAKEVGFRRLAAAGGASGSVRSSLVDNASLTTQARNKVLTDGDQQGRDSIDVDRMNVIKTGRDVARTAQSALTASARQEASSNLSRLQARATRDAAKTEALGKLAGKAISAGVGAYGNATATMGPKLGPGQAGPPSPFRVPASDLNGVESYMRKRWG